MEKSLWYYTIKFLNSLDNKCIFTIKELNNYINHYQNFNSGTCYGYRVILNRLEYIDHVKHGTWIKIKNIPLNLSSYQAKQMAWCWTKNFNTIA